MFEIEATAEYAKELGFEATISDSTSVEVTLGSDLVLCFENLADSQDTAIYFLNGGYWHSHGELWDGELAMVPLPILDRLLDGALLVSRASYASGAVETALVWSRDDPLLSMLNEGETVTYLRVARPSQDRGT